MKALRVIGGLLFFAVGLAVIALLGYANFGMPDGPGYDLIHQTAPSPSVALVFATILSLFSLTIGLSLIGAGYGLIANKK